MARHWIWTRAKHSDGLERPRFWEPLAAQKNRGVAPAPQTGNCSVCEMFYPRPVKEEMGRITFRPSTSHHSKGSVHMSWKARRSDSPPNRTLPETVRSESICDDGQFHA
jgi:hypothetical protein